MRLHMKKAAATILSLLMLLLAVCTPAAAADSGSFTLLKWEDYFKLEVLSFKIDGSEDDPYVMVYVRGINNTDCKIWTKVTNARVDNTPVKCAGRDFEAHSDTGGDSSKVLTFIPQEKNKETAKAIRNGRSIDLTISLVDSSNYKSMYEKHVAFDLLNSKAKTTGAKHTSASDYQTLSKGDQGEAVRQMQKRLIELKYMDGNADGVFGPKTLAAVRSFASQNDITITNDALPEMQALLFSDKALAYIEPWIPLMIGEELTWDPVDGVNIFLFQVDLINTSKTRTIKGYELKAYLTDVWGERVSGSPTYSKTDQIHVAPGESIKCSSFNFENWASVDTVYVGVSKIAFDDGEVRKVDNIDYFPCHILK